MVENKPLIFVDASVILKWLVGEGNTDEALEYYHDFYQNKIRLAVPSLCYYEVLNALGVKHHAIAVASFNHLLNLKLEEYIIDLPLANDALKIMKQIPKIAFYDAVYHALAIMHKGTFLTADKNYYDKAKKLKHIKLL